MEIVAQRTPLLDACRLAEKAVAVRPINQVLSNLLVDAKEGGCFLTGIDQGVGVRLPVPVRVELPGQVLIPARQFLGILKELADGELTIRSEPGRVHVRGRDAEFELRSDDASKFPRFPACPDGSFDEIAAEALRRTIQRTLFAVGKETSGNSFRGALWEIESDRIRLVATDNRRLAVAEVPALVSSGQGVPRQALIPVEALQLLEKMAAMQVGPIQALFRPREVFFRSAGILLCARLLDGAFPPWRKALSWEPRYRLLLPVGQFLSGVRQAAVLRDKTDNRLLLRFQAGRVTLRSRQRGTGQARVQQALVFPCTRDPVEVAFNPAYLEALLNVLDAAATVQMELRDADAPALFRAGGDYKHLLMPLRKE